LLAPGALELMDGHDVATRVRALRSCGWAILGAATDLEEGRGEGRLREAAARLRAMVTDSGGSGLGRAAEQSQHDDEHDDCRGTR
jgi:hypothetical protein